MMTVKEIVDRVRAAIDEMTQDGTDFSELARDEQDMTRIIVDKIPYALQYVIENAPLEKLDSDMQETFSEEELEERFAIGDDMVARVKLPDNLLRIVEARLSSWSLFPKPEPSTSQVYLMQQDPYARGSYDRPVNIITHEGNKRVLEMYSVKGASDKLVFLYIKKPSFSDLYDEEGKVKEDENVGVPTLLEASLVYQVAALTMTTYREDIADALFTISKRYMDLTPQDVSQQTV